MLFIPYAPSPTVSTPVVSFDAVGAGSQQNNVSTWTPSWTHTINSSATAVLTAFNLGYVNGVTVPAPTVKCGTSTMSQLKLVNNYGVYSGAIDLQLYIYGLLSPPTGTQTMTVNIAAVGSTTYYGNVNSASYFNVTGFGTAASNTGTGTTASLSGVASATNQLVFFAFGDDAGGGSFSGPNRYNKPGVNFSYFSLSFGDVAGATSVSTTATEGVSSDWAVAGVPLL